MRLNWLRDRFSHLPHDADGITIRRHARAFILRLMGGSIFADRSASRVSLLFLPLLEDLDNPTQYSRGSAALAWLYRKLCGATEITTRQIGGAIHVLQIWAWERIRCISPTLTIWDPLSDAPLGTRYEISFVPTFCPSII